MHDDERMDRLLRDAMTRDVPRLSPGFDARVMRRVRPRRLTSKGRAALVVYSVASIAATAWAMHGLPMTVIAGSFLIGLAVAIGVGVYARRIAVGD